MAEADRGEMTVRRMVLQQPAPGLVTKYGRYICNDGEFDNKWLAGEWTPIPGRSEPVYRKREQTRCCIPFLRSSPPGEIPGGALQPPTVPLGRWSRWRAPPGRWPYRNSTAVS